MLYIAIAIHIEIPLNILQIFDGRGKRQRNGCLFLLEEKERGIMSGKNDATQKRLEEIMEKLEQGVKDVFTSEKYIKYLSTMAKFHDYSFNNILLIAMQRPNATLIAGYQAWKKNFGRSVMHGEKGIRILAPSPYKIKQNVEKKDPLTGKTLIDKDGKPVMEEKEVTIPAYKVVTVFDVSQTEGKELPTIADELTGDVEQYEDFFAALEKTSPVPIGFEKIKGDAHGYYRLNEKRIAIDEGMSELQSLKTAIHEMAHAKMHDIDLNVPPEQQQVRPGRRTREVQAESVAYTVCQHYGLDTSDYSFEYVATWSSGREVAELKESLTVIRNTASELIKDIDKNLAQIQKAREQGTRHSVDKNCRQSVLENLHNKQNEINRDQKNTEQKNIENSDRRMER